MKFEIKFIAYSAHWKLLLRRAISTKRNNQHQNRNRASCGEPPAPVAVAPPHPVAVAQPSPVAVAPAKIS
jgi:hypothetical protein